LTDIKWIKITTDMFEDEKIKLIEKLPDGDALLIIWVKLLCLAGKVNSNGYILLTENIPYTEEMLATIFGRPIDTVRLALKAFSEYGMIHLDQDTLVIANWLKHQNIEGMEKVREQTRLRVQKFRAKTPVTSGNKIVTLLNAIEQEEESSSINDIKTMIATDHLFKTYESEIGMLTPMISEEIKDAATVYPEAWIIDAIRISAQSNKRSWKYIEGILKRWRTNGKEVDIGSLKPEEKAIVEDGGIDQNIKEIKAAFENLSLSDKEARYLDGFTLASSSLYRRYSIWYGNVKATNLVYNANTEVLQKRGIIK